MKGMLLKLMEYFPLLEVWAQCVYAGLGQKQRAKIKKYVKEKGSTPKEKVSIPEIMTELKKMGIEKGDILMIHSSMDGLKSLSGSPAELLSAIMELLGEEGTLAMAAFPHYKDNDVCEVEGKKYIIYDVKRTGVSTGLLPMVFCKMRGVKRSECPMNTVAVWGKHAEEMLQNEDKSDLVHGECSAWHYLAKSHAKILYLGLKVIEADTIVHVAEDIMDEDWPIAHWYEEQNYIIKDRNREKNRTFRIRNGYWHRYFTAQYSGRLMRKHNFIESRDYKGITLEMIKDAGEYVEFLMHQAQKGKLLYRIPRKYYKRDRQ